MIKNEVSKATTKFPYLGCQIFEGEGKIRDENRNKEDSNYSRYLIY